MSGSLIRPASATWQMNRSLLRQACTVPPPSAWRRVLAASSLMARTRSGKGRRFLTFLSVPGTLHYMEPGEDTNWLAQVRRGVAEQCVLALLTRGEMYGFELARELGARGRIIASEG